MMGKTRLSCDPAQHTAVHAGVTMSKAQGVKFTEKLKYFSAINSFDKSFKNPFKRANEPSSLFCFTMTPPCSSPTSQERKYLLKLSFL